MAGWGLLVSGRGDRRGMGGPGPSDQVRIDGLWSSSSPGHGKQRGNPRADLGGGVAHLGAFSGHGEATSGRGASRRARRGVAEVGLLPGCGSVCWWWVHLLGPRWARLWCPWVKKRGRDRLVSRRGAQACRKGGKWVIRTTASSSSSS
jgi:hypothetical protein